MSQELFTVWLTTGQAFNYEAVCKNVIFRCDKPFICFVRKIEKCFDDKKIEEINEKLFEISTKNVKMMSFW